MKKHTFSVIIPVYNSEKTIVDCINSLINQNYPKNKVEIIAVDNNSSDNSLHILKEYKNKITILCEPRKGAYYARNLGVSVAKGEIIAFTDSDCVVDENWIHSLNESFQNSSVSVVGGKISGLKNDSLIQKYHHFFSNNHEETSKIKNPFFCGGNMAIRKSTFEGVGGFSTKFRFGGDAEICSRIFNKRKNLVYNKNAGVYHFYSPKLLFHLRRQIIYSIWANLHGRRKNDGHVKSISRSRFLKKYGISLLFIRTLHEICFEVGRIIGFLLNILNYKTKSTRKSTAQS